MQLSQLEYFLAVAQERSFTRGAQSLHVVQSAVSAGIKQLENDLGADLFIRQGRKIRLAPAGEALMPHAKAVMSQLQRARDAVDAVRGVVQGTVELGTLSHLGTMDMSQVLLRIHREYPDVVIKLRQTVQGTRSSLAAVLDGSLDLALLSVADTSIPGIELHQIHAEPMLFVVPESHRLNGRKRVAMEELAGEQYIDFPVGWGNRTTVDAAFASLSLKRSVRTEVSSLAFALELVQQGLGVAFLPESTVKQSSSDGIWSIPVPLEWKIQLARSTMRPATAAEKVLMETILAQASSEKTTLTTG